jgi:para-aminobenzoate synthetase component 1
LREINVRDTAIVEEVDASAEQVLALALGLPARLRPVALDSCGYEEPDAHRLIVAFDPFETTDAGASDPLAALDASIARYRREPLENGLPPGAAVGTLSYDLGRRYERLPATALVDVASPDASLALYDLLFVHDYRTGRTVAVSTGLPASGAEGARRARARLREALGALAAARQYARDNTAGAELPASNFTPERYAATVERAKAYIAAGDIFQVNLTQRFSARLGRLAPEELFLRLRERNPAAFAAWLAEPGRRVVSASPERFLRVSGRRIEMWPIKGTRPRGTTEPEDLRYARELQESEKDRAENVMIVDLVRNDLGRVAEFGSVTADEICRLRALPTVFHLVSRVSARLGDGATACDALRAAFPCGSITGAPKIRAMEIVEELEGVRRGLSMGAIGYAGFDGSADWSVAIRTLEVAGGVARFNVGGGVVADSDPRAEYQETLWKASALLDALGTPLTDR